MAVTGRCSNHHDGEALPGSQRGLAAPALIASPFVRAAIFGRRRSQGLKVGGQRPDAILVGYTQSVQGSAHRISMTITRQTFVVATDLHLLTPPGAGGGVISRKTRQANHSVLTRESERQQCCQCDQDVKSGCALRDAPAASSTRRHGRASHQSLRLDLRSAHPANDVDTPTRDERAIHVLNEAADKAQTSGDTASGGRTRARIRDDLGFALRLARSPTGWSDHGWRKL